MTISLGVTTEDIHNQIRLWVDEIQFKEGGAEECTERTNELDEDSEEFQERAKLLALVGTLKVMSHLFLHGSTDTTMEFMFQLEEFMCDNFGGYIPVMNNIHKEGEG